MISQPVMQNQLIFLMPFADNRLTSGNHLLLSDSLLEHWLLRYSQNRGGVGGGGGS